MSTTDNIQLRRNGKRQACEPCRISKLRCDHALPHCQRCVRKRVKERCVYHPAPMTNGRTRHASEPASLGEAANDVSTIQQRSPDFQTSAPSYQNNHHSIVNVFGKPSPDKVVNDSVPSVGFLGPTSYSAIFLEIRLGDIGEDHPQDGHTSVNSPLRKSAQNLFNTVDDPHLMLRTNRGIKVLAQIPEQSLAYRLFDMHFRSCDVVIPKFIMRCCCDSMWNTYGEALKEPRKPELMSAMSRELCETATTPPPSSSTTEEWLQSFTGHRLRWEIIGNLLALWGLAVMTLSDFDPIFSSNNNGRSCGRKRYAGDLRELAEECLALSDEIDASNEFIVSLMFYGVTLQVFYQGDIG